MKVILENGKIVGCRIIACPVCWGKSVVCVGLKEDLEPILEPCSGCDGTGWIAYKLIDKEEKYEIRQRPMI